MTLVYLNSGDFLIEADKIGTGISDAFFGRIQLFILPVLGIKHLIHNSCVSFLS
jgi:hypothetical protein